MDARWLVTPKEWGSLPPRTASFRGVWKWSSVWSHKPRIAGSNPATATSFRIHSANKKTFYWKKAKAYPVILFHSSTAVVQLTVNQLVVGSIPACGAIFKGDVAQW